MVTLGRPRGPFPGCSAASASVFPLELLIPELPCEFCQALLAKLIAETGYRYTNSFLVADLCAGGSPGRVGDPGRARGPGSSGDSVVLGVLIVLGILEMLGVLQGLGIQGRLGSWEG